MKWIDGGEVARCSPYVELIDALRRAFIDTIAAPVRHHHATSPATTLLLMPSWSELWTGIKTVTVKSDNAAHGLPTVQAAYLLIDNRSGTPVAVLDGTELTRRRTAAASALGARFLARDDATTLALFGAGALAPYFAEAHAAVRPIRRILIANRTQARGEALAAELCARGFEAKCDSAEACAAEADIVSCITSATAPVLLGRWLKPGTHVDLAGAFTPAMREADAEAVARARVYVDTRAGAVAEAGDLLQAGAEGRFDFADIAGDLGELCRNEVGGRSSASEITLFKSSGTAIEDLAAAVLVYLRRT